ncbi:hypothetical protein B0H16DRAFT_1729659 [Mycena metata]|uniref:Uncharacterized protein n=1 Tax=Mycena metata TaxID=1033252 RepID=A0AAD7IAW6_9AGAR|nr:hypothetical protein B0H16DRAFT_1729659 [Mycena metata]
MLDHLAVDRTRIAAIESQSLHLQHAMRTLRVEKDVAQKQLDSYHYPVLTLPNEITSEIFLHYPPAYPYFTPGLWSVMGLSNAVVPIESQLEIGNLWLDRSRQCPLHINVHLIYPQLHSTCLSSDASNYLFDTRCLIVRSCYSTTHHNYGLWFSTTNT